MGEQRNPASRPQVSSSSFLLALVFASSVLVGLGAGGSFYEECDATWEPQNCWTYDDGNRLSLALVSSSSGTVIRLVCVRGRTRTVVVQDECFG